LTSTFGSYTTSCTVSAFT